MMLVNRDGGRVVAEGSTADILKSLGWQEVKESTAATPAEKSQATKATTRKRNTTTRKTEVENDADIKH